VRCTAYSHASETEEDKQLLGTSVGRPTDSAQAVIHASKRDIVLVAEDASDHVRQGDLLNQVISASSPRERCPPWECSSLSGTPPTTAILLLAGRTRA
jgi:hypothetical protein